jgi:hypothetical protein
MSTPTTSANVTDVRIDHSDSAVRRRAGKQLVNAFRGGNADGNGGGSLPDRSKLLVRLNRALRHDDYKVRWRAVRTCQELIAAVPSVRDAIEPLLRQRTSDSVPLVRQAARACLEDEETVIQALSPRYLPG